MTDKQSLPNDEARLAALVRATGVDAPPPDAALLAKLRERTIAELDSDRSVGFQPVRSKKEESHHGQAESLSYGRRPMVSLMMRAFVALAAVVLIAVFAFNPWTTTPVRGAPFSQVLKNLRDAESLRLHVVRGDAAAEVWISRPGLVRWEESPERYQVAAGSRWWKIDETENTVATGDSPWFRSPEQQIDLLALLDLGVNDAQPLLKSRPAEKLEFDGQQCYVYRTTLQAKEGPVEIEAFTDIANGQLAGIVARPPGVGPFRAPLAEMRLIAVNEVVDESKFVVAKTLTEDGRIGKLSDAQGIVLLRPMLAKRWTPVVRETLLKPGDWLRTELRGANAVKATLSSEVELTLGPSSLLECISPTEARLHNGTAQVNVTKKDAPAFTLLAPREGSQKFEDGKHLVRVDREEKLVKVDQQPVWLTGFEGTANNESLGSLIVNLPDGRNEPLTVGYHKVSVEIRDQIARTTIEESFVNHTPTRLEGVFHFPLPQDASISGFGMWIGNDLVEADVVEKQRAREIYETILRERRDPGLLEWTSGNLFKARVFPIEPNSEKRIKIVYTQVLPMRGNRYRYSYALRSDLLQTKPLRELSLSVLVNSALPLKSVTCPTYTVRTQQTSHSAQIDYSVQEYTPTRDFEVVFELDGQKPDVVAIPHRRGDDGYLLLQIMPPGGEGDFQREVLPDGEPLNLVLLCDTSASMDSEKRKQQAEFVAAVLASLTEKDHFNLVAADVGTAWAFPESVPATADNAGKAEAFLADRLSLGWTNLERAFDDVLKKSPAGANVVYIGDGIVSAGETAPSSFVKRLGRLIGEKDGDSKRTFHAVTVGNIHEAIVLKGIATVAGGSVRSVSGEQSPQQIALELLNELAQPALKDLQLEFRGVKVAGVYPERLPNVAAGTQQILVGRYLPTGADEQGKVIVTGMKGKEKVKYEATISFKDAEEGNSFIPRLWARSHLDQLLSQGQSQATRDEIIALSEEFHIITPYTSLLVLESDADRERFGVKRRYELRDGERFFAEGKANANYELLQQQMKRASDWRIALRRQMLRELSLLGRNPRVFQGQLERLEDRWNYLGDYRYPANGPMSGSGVYDSSGLVTSRTSRIYDPQSAESASLGLDFSLQDFEKSDEEMLGVKRELDARDKLKKESLDEELSADFGLNEKDSNALYDVDGEEFADRSDEYGFGGVDEFSKKLAAYEPAGSMPIGGLRAAGGYGGGYGFGGFSTFGRGVRGYYQQYEDYTAWVNMLFPPLAAPVKTKPAPAKDPEHWPAEAIALAKSLLRTDWAAKLEGGLELRRVSETFNPTWKRRESHHTDLTLYSTKAWLTRDLDPNDHCIIEFADEKQRGTYSRALLLGRFRNSVKQDLAGPPAGLEYFTTHSLHLSQRAYQAKLEPAGENQTRLILTNKEGTYELRYTIDTAKHVVVKLEQFSEGKLSSSTTYSDFVEVAGAWFATKGTIRDAENQEIGVTTYEFKHLTAPDFSQRMDQELATKGQVQFLSQPLPRLSDARQSVANGKADFNERMTMVLHYCQLQQWKEVLEQVDAIEKEADGKPGVRWLRTILLITMRRNEEAQQRLLDEAKKLAGGKSEDEIYLADFVLARAQQVASGSEMQEFVNLLKPVYERQPKELNVMPRWENYLLSIYDSLNRNEEALTLRRKLAEQNPWDVYQHSQYASYLVQAGRPLEAVEWLKAQIARPEKRTAMEEDSLYSALAEQYRNQGRWADLLEFTAAWIVRKPTYGSAYQQHLSALTYNEQLDAANALAEQWLKEARVERKLTADERARLDAAISWAQGNGHNLSFQRMDERWYEPLKETALYFARHKHHFDVVQRIFDYRFGESDQADRVRGEFLTLLRNELPQLTSQQISYFVSATLGGRLEVPEPINGRKQLHAGEVPLEIWTKIATQLRERWPAEKDQEERHRLGEALKSVYANRFADSEYLPFLRERLKTAADDYKRLYRSELFDALLGRPWEERLEDEAFALLLQLPETKEPAERLAVQVPALYRLVDAMITNRQAANEKQLGDSGDTTKLTRTELAKKRVELKKAAMAAIADRLASLAKDEANPLTPWLRIEQTWLNVRLDRNLPQATELCWKILDVAPPKTLTAEEEQELEPAELQKRFFDLMLQHRALMTVLNLAARKNAEPASIERLQKYFDEGIKQGGDSTARWRSMKFVLLVALDRADELEKNLRQWIRDDVSTSPWRTMLGILLAERGKLAEAVQLFESAEKDKLLNAAHYKMLADWYLVLDQRQAYERARIETFKQLPEYQLSQLIYRFRNRWYVSDRPLPSELDDDTLFAFRAIFEKSANPEQYLWHLRDLYAACRDFRLLDMLPDAMLGRSPQQVYGFLGGLRSQVLQELRNEAASDEILSRIKTLRESERTATDLRALDLLEALIERQSSEVPNQPGPHAANALAALKRAFEREWGEGEPRLMARFLSDLGTLHDQKLVDEQVRELRSLQQLVKEETRDHLYITRDLANVLFWSYHKRDEAIQIMQIEAAAWLRTNEGHWSYQDNEVLNDYVRLYEGANRHSTGEAILLKELRGNDSVEQRKWLETRLLTLYRYALEAKTEVSFGSGDRLFVNAVDLAVRNLQSSPDDNHTYYLADQLNDLFRVANDQQLASRQSKLRTYAFETLPKLLKAQRSQYRNLATGPIENIQKILGHKAALQYVVERLEQYPQWLEISYDRGWNAFGSQLAYQRHEAASKGESIKDLEPRVLKLAIAELKRYLRTGEQQSADIYHIGYTHFWAEKKDDFAKAAEEVYAERKTSGRRVVAIAYYLWGGLSLEARAIEMLLIANQNGILDDSGQETLVTYLHSAHRFAESIPILQKLIELRPDQMSFRVLLLIAYHQSDRKEQLQELLAQTDKHFHQEGRWTEGNIGPLASACNQCGLYEQAVGYFKEAIAQRQRNQGGVTVGDATLSSWYQGLASAHSALHQTKEAVDAASAAIVCWGAQQKERTDAISALRNVLGTAQDLDDYVKHLDEQAAKTGQDSVILRKTIGHVYKDRGNHAAAITQLQLAVAMQPNDKELHQWLIQSYDALGKNEEGTRELLRQIDFDRHDLALYTTLAQRLGGNEAEAERAATSIIEAAPTESENHAAYAELMQQRNRWDEAIPHWRQVAELRRLEPTGLLKLAEAQIHEKQWNEARQTVRKLQQTSWPTRFSDVEQQTRQLQEKLPK
jgi:predicted Zn-dependent protease